MSPTTRVERLTLYSRWLGFADPNQPDAEGGTPTDHARRMLAEAELEVESLLVMSGQPAEDHPSEWLHGRVNHARSILALLTEAGGR